MKNGVMASGRSQQISLGNMTRAMMDATKNQPQEKEDCNHCEDFG